MHMETFSSLLVLKNGANGLLGSLRNVVN
uniref:Uncharacterized protein n=1 Tax=Rhizophora mucronata TaxID=61149 RepID=A0A2P2Q4R3_RHIMU